MRYTTLVLVLLAGLVAFRHLAVSEAAVITIHPDQAFQRMTGWEVTLRLWETNKAEDRFDDSWENHAPEIFDRLVNELGINRVRLEIKSGIENAVDYWELFEKGEIGYLEYKKHYYQKINDNDDPRQLNAAGIQFSMLDYQVEKMLLPIKKLVEANGEKLFINLCYVDFKGTGSQGSFSHALDAEEYAELITATFDRLAEKYGITPDALEITLEPENSVHWRGKQIGTGLVAAAARLKQSGYSPEFIAPSTTYASNVPEYFDEMIAVPGTENVLSTIAYHRYDHIPDAVTLPPIHARAEKYGLRTAMLESLEAGSAQLHADLTEANISAWQQYGIAVKLPEEWNFRFGYYYALQVDGQGKPRVVLSESGRDLIHYFKYVRMNAVRIGATSSDKAHRVAAFRNSDGSHVLVVRSRRSAELEIRLQPAGTYGLRYTTADEFHESMPDIAIAAGEGMKIVMPGPGMLTIYQKL